MSKRVPPYLKEISTSLYGPTEGDNASEWGFAKGYNETSAWDAEKGSGQYLGWWGRGGRDVYYFTENGRPAYYKNPESYYWKAYDWYRDTAEAINTYFKYEEEVHDFLNKNPGYFDKPVTLESPYTKEYYVGKIRVPEDIRNIKGIGAWLMQRYSPTEQVLSWYNNKARERNNNLTILWEKEHERRRIELENQKKAAEDERYNTIVTQLGKLREEIGYLRDDVNKGAKDKDKEFSLFRSELTSRIPDPNLNVSRYEHDEDIAQLNETLQGIRGSMDKNAKKTDDSIAFLQRRVNVSRNDISRTNKSIMDISKRVNEDEKKNRLFFIENKKNLLELDHKFEKVEGETLAQSNEINNLRKNLQSLGGETREFIDNTKRQEQALKAKVAKRESVVTRTVKKAAFPDLTKRPWLKESVTGRFFQLANQW